MTRMIALVAALLLAGLSITTTALARLTDSIRFTLEQQRGGDVQLTLKSSEGRQLMHTSNSFAAATLAGLDLAALRAAGSQPIRFALAREPGRIDCAGQGGNSLGSGRCSFAANAAFTALLAARGVRGIDDDRAFEMALTGVDRGLVEAIHVAGYPTPNAEDLIALAAVGVDGRYIGELSRRGYKPAKLDDLVAFRALGIQPAYIDALRRSGFGPLDADDIVEMKAVGVSPDYLAALASAGYRNLSASDVVQLKALNVTPAFISGLARAGYAGLTTDQLVEFRALGVTPEYIEGLRRSGMGRLSASELVQLRAVGFAPDRRR